MLSGVILAPALDAHAFAVKAAASELGGNLHIVDTREFCSAWSLSHHQSASSQSALLHNDMETIDLGAQQGVWWRRPFKPLPPAGLPVEVASAVAVERTHAIYGTILSLPNSFNHPGISRAAGYKPHHLSVAKRCGLRTPDTLFSNDEAHIRDFLQEKRGNVVYKLYHSFEHRLIETRRWSDADFADLHSVASCPCIFQEFVAGVFDLRITVVEDAVFCARIDFDAASDCIDTRFTQKGIEPYPLGADLSKKIVRLVQALGLVYATVDMRVDNQGEATFFELNPEGQYLWIEIETELPISAAIACRILGLPVASVR